jgi:phasin
MLVMAENGTASASPKSKKPVASFMAPAFEMPKFEMPTFELPKFDLPSMEVPAAFREIAEKGIAQAKENYDKMKNAAEQATDVLEETYSAASKGYADYGLKVIETARANSNAAFDFAGELMTAKSFAEVVEKTTAYMRSQFDAATAQTKDLAEQAQKCANDTYEPIKDSIANFGKAA